MDTVQLVMVWLAHSLLVQGGASFLILTMPRFFLNKDTTKRRRNG